MLSVILNGVYLVLALLALPMVACKRLRTGKYRLGWGQKLTGRLPERRDFQHSRIWLHAVSVGEVLQLRQIVKRLHCDDPAAQILITTTTETGFGVAKEAFPQCEVAFFPLDFSWSVSNALNRVQPDLIILVELELWPNFILGAAARKIPLALINGRLSERSFRGYSRIRPLVQRLLRCFSLIASQTEEYHQRFLALGADPQSTLVTGSIKFDGVMTSGNHPFTQDLAAWMELDPDAPVFVAGSTQAPEEQYAVDVYRSLLAAFPTLQLIIVPRHPERGPELVEMIQQSGFDVLQRSSRQFHTAVNRGDTGTRNKAVVLLDTVGELGACWGLADVAFVGGSFTRRGGQNMLEPAALGIPVSFGPNTWNFKQIVELLLARQGARTVHSPAELEQFVREMLSQPPVAAEMGIRARTLVLSQQGATDRTINALQNLPRSSGNAAQKRAA